MKSKLLVTLVILSSLALTANAAYPKKSKKKKGEPTPRVAATPAPPQPPSVDISKFTGDNLDKVLGPLDQKIVLPRPELEQLRNSFSARFSRASLVERAQFQAALSVCDALAQAMNERQTAITQRSATWPQRAEQLRQYISQL
ncbi:MAG: hypothetical protein ABJB22_03350, partial [Verrucomicrobiota bacterium]